MLFAACKTATRERDEVAARAEDGDENEAVAAQRAGALLRGSPVLSVLSARRERRVRPLIVHLRIMSMYTQLLDAALEQRPPSKPEPNRNRAVERVRRRRQELELGVPQHNLDTVPAVLALQIGYDVALLELAEVVGIESEPSRFEQPERERDRLCQALHSMGIDLDTTNATR
jgi:hypothetical protein